MENTEINNYTDLVMRIMHLKQEKFRQEEELKYTFRELTYSLNPITAAKKYLHELAENSGVKYDITKVGLNLAANLIIGRILGKNNGFKSILSALLVEKLSSSFIKNKLAKIISRISNHIQRPLEQEPTNE